jgi:hypothetical protein
VRFVDENIDPAADADFTWADAVFVSGMHVQRRHIGDICARAHRRGRPVVLGGPSVTSSPELYPEADILHLGEMGDATEALFAHLAEDCSRPPSQMRFETKERTPLESFPIPAYELVSFDKYFLGSMQFSSGCPYECEFCDIPGLYGRVPRLKSPQKIIAELDKLIHCGLRTAVYFVDDNFIGNRRALRELLPQLVAWQEKNGFPVTFAFEATLNIAKHDDLLDLLHDACFTAIFCGVETPEVDALHAMSKGQNIQTMPILDAVKKLNAKGMEVVAGVIMGLDTDEAQSPERIRDFIDTSQIAMLTVNLLLSLNEDLESNVVFKRPYNEVVAEWRDCLAYAYDPARLYARYDAQSRVTYPNRRKRAFAPGSIRARDVRRGLTMLVLLIWKLGVIGDYRRVFWSFAWPRLKAGKIEEVIACCTLAKHLISFARKACAGELNASHYSTRVRGEATSAEARLERVR